MTARPDRQDSQKGLFPTSAVRGHPTPTKPGPSLAAAVGGLFVAISTIRRERDLSRHRSLCAASMSRSIQTMDPYWSRGQLDRHGSGHLGHREEEVVGRWKVGRACLREAVSVDPGVVKTD